MLRSSPPTNHSSSLLALLLVATLATGCTMVRTASATLRPPPVRQERAIAGTAWIRKVDVFDPKLTNNRQLGDSLALSIEEYAQEAGHFSELKRLPGSVKEGDCVLDFSFDNFSLERRVHPAFVPGMFLTLTLYAWVGGPVYEDFVTLSGELMVTDTTGVQLADARSKIEKRACGSIYGGGLIESTEERTTLIATLLDEVSAKMAQKSTQ